MFIFKNNLFHFSKSVWLGCTVALLMVGGCDITENHLKADREGNMEVQDYRDAMASRVAEDVEDWVEDEPADAIPEIQPYISSGAMDSEPTPLVSISVNQSVPLRDVLFELAKQADYDLELDPRIRGSIIFTARERPFDQVIERISAIAGLRYNFDDGVLRVELDMPYNKIYKIDYLSYVRNNTSQISNDISVVSGDGTDTGSNFQSNAESSSDFWGELEANLEQLIGGPGQLLRTENDPRISVAEQNPDVQAVAPASEDGSVQVAAPEAVLNVESLPVDDENASSSGSRDDDPNQPTFTLNRQAGIVNVFANDRTHKEVAEYMALLEKAVTSQVLIEAKVLEVTLSDQYATGINWDFIGLSNELGLGFGSDTGSGILSSLTGGTTRYTLPGVALPDSQAFTASYVGNDIQALIGAISQFGTVRALASPRLTVLNNQSAILNVATNRVFFEIDIDVTTEDGTTNTDVESEIRNVPEGVLVNVQPSINLDDGTISMALRPTITNIDDTKNDPAVAIAVAECGAACAGITSEIPELNVQEIDSVIKVNSGQPVVMGGLLQDRVETSNSGVPVLKETPIVGNLFKDHNDTVSKTELVIFLKATILENPGDSIHNTDKDLYRQFSSDRRPLKL